MTVTDIHKDLEELTMTVTASFDAPVERVWQMWANPRLLERWWGPPEYPATFVDHDLTPGGRANYFMTGPEGDRHHGWWQITAVEAPHAIEVEDGFADDEGNPNTDLPTSTMRMTLVPGEDGGTTMQILTRFPSTEAMEQTLEMGVEEGITAAIGQIPALLAEAA